MGADKSGRDSRQCPLSILESRVSQSETEKEDLAVERFDHQRLGFFFVYIMVSGGRACSRTT